MDLLAVLCQKKVHLVKAMVFPVVRYGCESWSTKKAEHQRIEIGRASCRERVANFIFLGFKITLDGDWSHRIKRHLLLGRIPMTNLTAN